VAHRKDKIPCHEDVHLAELDLLGASRYLAGFNTSKSVSP
jgi:hypothetical protein